MAIISLEKFTTCIVLLQSFEERTSLYFYTTIKIIEGVGNV
jgi:hypothetical protein